MSQLRRELLGALNCAGAFLRQILVTRCLLLREHEPSLYLLQLGSIGPDLRLLDVEDRVERGICLECARSRGRRTSPRFRRIDGFRA